MELKRKDTNESDFPLIVFKKQRVAHDSSSQRVSRT